MIKVRIQKPFCTYVTYMIVINHRTPHFVSPKSIFNEILSAFPSKFCVLYRSPSLTQRSVSHENAFKKIKNPSLFFTIIGSNNSFILFENNFSFFKIAKLEFKVTVHSSLWEKKHPVVTLEYIPWRKVDIDYATMFKRRKTMSLITFLLCKQNILWTLFNKK